MKLWFRLLLTLLLPHRFQDYRLSLDEYDRDVVIERMCLLQAKLDEERRENAVLRQQLIDALRRLVSESNHD